MVDAAGLDLQMGRLHTLLSLEHARLHELLERATRHPRDFDLEAFEAFRSLLLRHIMIEERILMTDAKRRKGGTSLKIAKAIHIEHGALGSLMVPTPDAELVGEIQGILSGHDKLEEEPGGLYEQCEDLAGDDLPWVIARVRAAPVVPAPPHRDGPGVKRTAAAALLAASRAIGRGKPHEE